MLTECLQARDGVIMQTERRSCAWTHLLVSNPGHSHANRRLSAQLSGAQAAPLGHVNTSHKCSPAVSSPCIPFRYRLRKHTSTARVPPPQLSAASTVGRGTGRHWGRGRSLATTPASCCAVPGSTPQGPVTRWTVNYEGTHPTAATVAPLTPRLRPGPASTVDILASTQGVHVNPIHPSLGQRTDSVWVSTLLAQP